MTDRTSYNSRRATLKEIMGVLKNEPDSTELVTDSGHFQGLIKQARLEERAKILELLVDEPTKKYHAKSLDTRSVDQYKAKLRQQIKEMR